VTEATRKLTLATVVPLIAFVVVAPAVFAVVFGARWREAGVYAAVIAPALASQLISMPSTHVLNAAERLSAQLTLDVVRLVASLGSIALAITLNASPRMAVAAWSIAVTALSLVSLLLNRGAARRLDASAGSEDGPTP
jgi:O-antigen/teichoic acid export membrane protein